MKPRIRGAGIVLDAENRMLLVHEQSLSNKMQFFWIPPGGGFEEQDSSVLACMEREVREETGLIVQGGRLLYLREFVDINNQTHNLEIMFLVREFQGEINPDHPQELVDAGLTRQARWFTQQETKENEVYPIQLREEFWQDLASGVEQTRYLGDQIW